MRRLYHQVYLTIIVSLVAVVVVAGMLWRFAPNPVPVQQAFEVAGELAVALLPPANQGVTAQQQALERLAARLKIDLALYDGQQRRVAAVGRSLPVPRSDRESGGWIYGPGGPAWAIHLPDDRWIVARAPMRGEHPALKLIAFLGAIALAVAACAYPLMRGLTGRLERLQAGVESLGAGDLSARVKVEGKDEVARLAESFNRAAGRIQGLVAAHKLLLANTSHELRTPLSRIRLGVELLKKTADPRRRAELEQDIAELDALIDDVLLSSRLEAVEGLEVREEVDLLAVAAEEANRYERCCVTGDPVVVLGDRALLRRMTRNLIDNAERHGVPPVEINVRREPSCAVLTICDRGPGIPADERERAFLPFYRLAGAGSRGAGLGLALVRQIARRHGGDAIWAASPERPSAIRVTIPIGDDRQRIVEAARPGGVGA